jgi:hypothetical protein
MGFYKTISEIESIVTNFSLQKLPASDWTHEAHLTVALWFIKKSSLEEATCFLRSGIIIYNKSVGTENSPVKGYHETLTLFWIRIIDKFIQENPEENFLTLCNSFLESEYALRDYPMNFYSREVLFSTAARAFWTAPDKVLFEQ